MTRALVIGGPGFIGQAACKELMRRGVETVAASRRHHPYGTFTSHHVLDRARPDGLEEVLARVRPDVVLDLSGAPPGALHGVERTVAVTCERRPAPSGTTVLFAPAAMGPADPTLRIAQVIERVEAADVIEVPAWASRGLGLCWVKDLGFACALACDLRRSLDGAAFDVGFDGVTLEALLLAIGRALGRSPRLQRADGPAWPYQPAELDLGRSRAELGFEPSALEDALAETLAWHRVRRMTAARPAGRPKNG